MAERSTIKPYELLLVGGSAGSLEVILSLLPALQGEKELAIVLVLHRRSAESMLSHLLGERTSWTVKEAEEKEAIVPGTIYIAPADYHLLIEEDKTFSLDYSEKVNYSRPSIDVTFETAAETYGPNVVALLLSGANHDGTAGLQKIKAAGGYVLVQDPEEAVVAYMPQHAIENVEVDAIVKTSAVPALIHQLQNT
jgi:two-component system, chemotaxis family, protein-glutamate methylesterase/glutaminase